MTVTVLISAFAPFGNFHLNIDEEATLLDLYDDILVHEPLLSRLAGLRLNPTARPTAPASTTLADLCQSDQKLVSFRLTPPTLGGKGGFGSQLRAAGGRMSSQKTSNNDSCRDLSGRRLSTLKEAKKLQTYLESEPERKKAALEAKKEKLAKLERQAGIIPGSSKDGNPHAGQKRRLDDTEFLEESQAIVENVKSSVVEGLRKKKAKMDPPPVPEKALKASEPVNKDLSVAQESTAAQVAVA